MTERKPDFQCTACGCDMYMFPPNRADSSDWSIAQAAYRNCRLDVPTPHCGDCVIEGVKAGKFAMPEDKPL